MMPQSRPKHRSQSEPLPAGATWPCLGDAWTTNCTDKLSASSVWSETVGGCVVDAGDGCGGGLSCASPDLSNFVVCLARTAGGGLFHYFVRSVDGWKTGMSKFVVLLVMSIDDATITDRRQDPVNAHYRSRFQQELNGRGWVTLGQLIAQTSCLLMSSASSVWSETVGGCVVDAGGGCGGGLSCASPGLSNCVFCLARTAGGGLFHYFVRSVDGWKTGMSKFVVLLVMSIDDAAVTDLREDPVSAHCRSRFQQELNF